MENLEDKVCSLEQAEGLKGFGWPQNTKYYWRRWSIAEGYGHEDILTKEEAEESKENPMVSHELYSAYTAQELASYILEPSKHEKSN